jgi:hypothetical protein
MRDKRPHFLNSMMSSRSSCHRVAHPHVKTRSCSSGELLHAAEAGYKHDRYAHCTNQMVHLRCNEYPFSCIFIIPKLSRMLVLMKSTTSTKSPLQPHSLFNTPHPVHIFNQKPGLQLRTLFQPILNFNQNPNLQHWILFQTIESSISIQAHCNQTFLQPMSGAQFQPKPFARNFFFNPSIPQFQTKPKFPIYFLSLSLSLSLLWLCMELEL